MSHTHEKYDKKFYEENVAIHYRHVFNFIKRAVYDFGLAEDLTQETMEKAWLRLDQLRNPNKIRSWLFSIARNEMKMYFRSNEGYRVSVIANPWLSLEEQKMIENDVLEMLSKTELHKQLWKALIMVPEPFRRIIHLRYFCEFNMMEVAEIMNLKYVTARVYLHRGLKEMRTYFDNLQKGVIENESKELGEGESDKSDKSNNANKSNRSMGANRPVGANRLDT